MIYGLIINKLKAPFFTDLKEMFDTLGSMVNNYNWLLSDYSCNVYPCKKIPIDKEFVWFTGEEFIETVSKHNIQFIWGVATAYAKDIPLGDVLKYSLPFANGYTGFWKSTITMQNSLADIEIVPWDASLVLVISKSKMIVDKFAKEYPDSQDLREYNQGFITNDVNKSDV